jgi:hypothetical protein
MRARTKRMKGSSFLLASSPPESALLAIDFFPFVRYSKNIRMRHTFYVTPDYAKGDGAMDELIKMVADKAGISQDQAKAATQTVVDFLKTKLPGPVGAQIDSLMAGGGNVGDMAKGLGGLFGKK